ncbi:MAG: hypothetical protein ACLQPD_33550 [Desulfomonilaceae bacterium]
MEWLILILVVLIPPILIARFFLWTHNRLSQGARRSLIYMASFAVWFGACSVFLTGLRLTFSTRNLSRLEGELHLPEFPLRDAGASSRVTIPLRRLLVSSRFSDYWHPHHDYISAEKFRELLDQSHPLLLHADALLRSALARAGQYEASYYSVPDGFALVSRLEQIDEDGSPMYTSRWDLEKRHIGSFSVSEYLFALFKAPPGYYRLAVFVITPHSFNQSKRTVPRDVAEAWLRCGGNALPPEVALQPYTELFICTVLIYEFEKYDTLKEPITRVPGRLPVMAHLEKSGWGRFLR